MRKAMNLCRLLNWICIWCASFGMSNAATPLPPNTGMTLVADVAGTTLANDAYWADKCKVIPPTALFIVVQMGDVTDFFKPINSETSFCEMLTSNNKHQWSRTGQTWTTPVWQPDPLYFGGSSQRWPQSLGSTDSRMRLSYWGSKDGSSTGGCCSTDPTIPRNGDASVGYWRIEFTMAFAVPLHPPPQNTGMSFVVDVPGTTLANDAFWAEQCKTIPSNALFVVVDMGAVRDFYKPVNGTTTFCEMLQAHNKHQWSVNGVDWFDVEFGGGGYGGSAGGWPRDNGRGGDARVHLSIWGSDGFSGGCCSASAAVARTDGSN